MDIAPTTLTIADYCQGLASGAIRVNHDYQRSDDIWPLAARQFLIETVLLDFPVPKFSLHQVTNLADKSTVRFIVDGQQRSSAICDFYSGELALSAKSNIPDVASFHYADLPDDLKHQFLGYLISVDLFLNATNSEVREAFRRINSYTVPLNPEEQRHAIFQGALKWFIYRLTSTYGDVFAGLGILSENQLIRMQDAKLFSEVAHAVLNGVETTNRAKLDALYKTSDAEFPEETDLSGRIERSMDELVQLSDLRGSELMKPHHVYSLLLALMHFAKPIPKLEPNVPVRLHGRFDPAHAIAALRPLADALEAKNNPPRTYRAFVKASTDRTNVKAQRIARIKALYIALTS